MKENLFIHHHLGLGDHFDCNGMVRYLHKEWSYDQVSVFAKDNYYDTVNYMHRNDDYINEIKIDRSQEYEEVFKIINSCDSQKNDLLTSGHQHYDHTALNKNC